MIDSTCSSGDARGKFGIDRTNTNFKTTPGMLQIIEEQRKRRIREESDLDRERQDDRYEEKESRLDVSKLIRNVKQKFSKQT